MSLDRLWLLSLIIALCLASSTFGATLVQDEVAVLKEIANTLQKNDWDFSVDPCSGQSNWYTTDPGKAVVNQLQCNCSFANATCHVTNIVLKGQNLAGMLPPELVRLPYLQEFDVSLNYLNGTIPPEWGSLKLLNISLSGNRLMGSIPRELGNISTLQSLDLEFNQLSGNLPQELGNPRQLQRLFLTSNNFTGELPATFANLVSLQEFRIGGNQFSGTTPNFIQNWTSLNKLVIEGSGLSGPIPFDISFPEKLTELRISDLNGSDSTFPQLNNLTVLQTLVLRSCKINGTLPEYLGRITSINQLDLSFNKLSGPIPDNYVNLRNAIFIYLTGNFLNGSLPQWMHESGEVDVSYNNFSLGSTELQTCGTGTVNWFDSSLNGNNLGIVPCLRSFRCNKTSYFLYINSGGNELEVNGNTYEDDDDTDRDGAATFYKSETNWAVISTGSFLDSDKGNYYIWPATYNLTMPNAELYKTARVSPLSLSYYAFCFGNGRYMIKLYFAEIMFSDDNTYNSLGRRVFDIYIQGKLVLKDFNIAEEAGGAGKAITKEFPIVVTDSTLEIRFYWAGKGTTAIPFKAVYGPLVSAVSVEPDFTLPSSGISTGAVVGIVFAIAIIIMLVLGVLWWKGCIGRKWSLAKELDGLNMQTSLFTLRQIKVATKNFAASNKIGEGGFGPVYKGFLSNGTMIAVKQLSSKSRQGNREFINEIGMISALQHPCLVKLYGCCAERDQLLLIYEYIENNSLARALFGPKEFQLELDWPTRHKICVGIATGLAYLHEESSLKVVHRDIKAANVLLDKDLNPKISDFGLAKLNEEENTHISTRIAGTYGYMAPEYALHGYLTNKADVYSFGIVALEIVSGKTNTLNQPKHEGFHLLDWAQFLNEKGDLMELVDWKLNSKFNKEEVIVVIKVALLCTNITPTFRPTMSSVVSMLEGKSNVQELTSDGSEALDDVKLTTMSKYYQQIGESKISKIHGPSTSWDGPWIDSTTSVTDLYPLHLDSFYMEERNY